MKSKSYFWSLVRKTTLNCPNLLFMALLPALLTCYFLCDIWWRLNYNVRYYYASCNDMTCPRWIHWWLSYTEKPENCFTIVFTFIFQTQQKYPPMHCNTQNTSCILLTRKETSEVHLKTMIMRNFISNNPLKACFVFQKRTGRPCSIVSGWRVWQADKTSSAQQYPIIAMKGISKGIES